MPKKNNVEKELVSAAAAAPAPARRRPAASRKLRAAVEQVTAEVKPAQPTRIAIKPSHEEIAKLAYFYWEARGCQIGTGEEDWTRAERELLSR